jgi:rsbT co-antagonist protein RsbR
MSDPCLEDRPERPFSYFSLALRISGSWSCTLPLDLTDCEKESRGSPWNLGRISGIYLMPLAGVHLLEVAGKSWYSLTNLQGTQTIRLVQVQTVQGEENKFMARKENPTKELVARNNQAAELALDEATSELLRELVAHLRQNRTQLREGWVESISATRLLTAMTKEEIFAEATSVYDSYVEALETGTLEALQTYARNLSERIIPRGVETHEVVGIVLLLRDVLARSLFAKYQTDFKKLNRILDAYEPAANRIANTVAVGFVQERERVIRQQQEAIRELSTPVLQVRERLLILPIIGVIDPQRARQLTEQLLRGIRTNRAKVVVIDITGVAAMDLTVANNLVQTVEASRLLGATVIVTGLSPEIAQTLVTIGVDLGKMNTVGDLQGGIEQAERLLGYKVEKLAEPR